MRKANRLKTLDVVGSIITLLIWLAIILHFIFGIDNHAERMIEQPKEPVPCSTDLECMEKNPHLGSY